MRRRRRKPTQWTAGIGYGVANAVANATATLFTMAETNLQGLSASSGLIPNRYKIERIVGDLTFQQASFSANCCYRVSWGIVRVTTPVGGPIGADPESPTDAGISWLVLKHAFLSPVDQTVPQLHVDRGYEAREGEGFLHFDTRVKRSLRPDEGIIFVFKVTQVAGAATATNVAIWDRVLVSQIA